MCIEMKVEVGLGRAKNHSTSPRVDLLFCLFRLRIQFSLISNLVETQYDYRISKDPKKRKKKNVHKNKIIIFRDENMNKIYD